MGTVLFSRKDSSSLSLLGMTENGEIQSSQVETFAKLHKTSNFVIPANP